jgi:CheY-like chemotaxis protein
MNVLLVDDDIEQAKNMAGRLEFGMRGENLYTYIATSIEDAGHAIERDKYDAVLIDLVISNSPSNKFLSEETASTVLEIVRRSNPDTKIIAYSNYFDSLEDADLRKQFNADFIFTKRPGNDDVGDQLAGVLMDFLPSAKSVSERPDPALILPARKSIITVNTRLAEIFRKDPRLLKEIDPFKFEELVAELFEEDGYEVVLTPRRADGGKDIYVYKTDSKLRSSFLVECKRYTPPNKVGVEIARQLYGCVQQEQRSGGVIVTTSYFTRCAKEFADAVPYQLFLRDIEDLNRWLQGQ